MAKSSKRLAVSSWRTLAAMLLSLGLAALSSGCFVLEDDPVLPDVPRKRNSPLRILPGTQRPTENQTTIYVGSNCPTPEFSVKVWDDDFADVIEHKWWVDAPAGYVPDINNREIGGTKILGGSSGVRTVNAPKGVINALGGKTDKGIHFVEVFATDGYFDADSLVPHPNAISPAVVVARDGGCLPDDGGCYANGAQLPDGTTFDAGFDTLTDEAYRVSYMWVVKVEACP